MTARRSLRALRAMIAASLVGLTLLAPGSARATFPGPVGRIAFDDFITGQIYAVNPNGGALVQLSDLGRKNFASDPDWTVDGSHVLYHLLPPGAGLKYRRLYMLGFLPILLIVWLVPGVVNTLLWPVTQLMHAARALVGGLQVVPGVFPS